MADISSQPGTSRSEDLGRATRHPGAAASGSYSGTSKSGNLGEAMRSAVVAARRELNTNFFTWELKEVRGSVGGFVGANDVVVTIDARAPGAPAVSDVGTEVETRGWHAWQNRMPGGPGSLHVTGICVFPTAGYVAELRPADPQGINPTILILELVVTRPTGVVDRVFTEVEVRYSEDTDKLYSDVQIVPENILVPVQQVW